MKINLSKIDTEDVNIKNILSEIDEAKCFLKEVAIKLSKNILKEFFSLEEYSVLLAEASNLYAKMEDDYSLKAATFVAAALQPEVSFGWNFEEEENVFFIESNGHVISAHDPYGEIYNLCLKKNIPINIWEKKWDRIIRQKYGFAALRSERTRRLLKQAQRCSVSGCASIKSINKALSRLLEAEC